jgi:hypothetical protein
VSIVELLQGVSRNAARGSTMSRRASRRYRSVEPSDLGIGLASQGLLLRLCTGVVLAARAAARSPSEHWIAVLVPQDRYRSRLGVALPVRSSRPDGAVGNPGADLPISSSPTPNTAGDGSRFGSARAGYGDLPVSQTATESVGVLLSG